MKFAKVSYLYMYKNQMWTCCRLIMHETNLRDTWGQKLGMQMYYNFYLWIKLIADVLLNLTQLEVFDISNNELGAYEYGRLNFSFPGNLTSLFISHNRLQHLPLKLFKNPVALQSIDLSNNLIETFDFNLLKRVKNGLKLNIAGLSFNLIYNY